MDIAEVNQTVENLLKQAALLEPLVELDAERFSGLFDDVLNEIKNNVQNIQNNYMLFMVLKHIKTIKE